MIWVKKNNEWSESVEAVVEIAEYVSQAAFTRIQRALQQECTFVQRVVPNIVPLLRNKKIPFLKHSSRNYSERRRFYRDLKIG